MAYKKIKLLTALCVLWLATHTDDAVVVFPPMHTAVHSWVTLHTYCVQHHTSVDAMSFVRWTVPLEIEKLPIMSYMHVFVSVITR